jgi:CheY-like chemotaxis protein
MKKPMVLLVEDSDDDAYFFQRTLERSGVDCGVHRVANGVEAVEFLREASSSNAQPLPQTVFLDLKMPVLDGFEVLEWMRTQAFPSHMQVRVLSGSDHPDDKARALRLGAADYLVKPVKVADLQRFLSDICPPKMGVAV